MMTFIKKDNFGGILGKQRYGWNNHVIYENDDPTQAINELKLFVDTDLKLNIIAQFNNEIECNTIVAALRQAGFNVLNYSKSIHFKTSHADYFGHFFSALMPHTPELVSIKPEIARTLGIDFNQPYTCPEWLTEGDFGRVKNLTNGKASRSVQYRNNNLADIVESIDLSVYDGGYVMISVKTRDSEKYKALFDMVMQNNLCKELLCSEFDKKVRFHSPNKEEVTNFINKLNEKLPELNKIKQEILDALAMTLPKPNSDHKTSAAYSIRHSSQRATRPSVILQERGGRRYKSISGFHAAQQKKPYYEDDPLLADPPPSVLYRKEMSDSQASSAWSSSVLSDDVKADQSSLSPKRKAL